MGLVDRVGTRDPLAVALGRAPPPVGGAGLIGLEHEYRVEHDGQPVDFRNLIHRLGLDGSRLDPGDRNAYRCPTGGVLTCDEEEAEAVTPPLALRPGFTKEVSSWAGNGRRSVTEALPDGFVLKGYSTHLSAAVPERLVAAVAGLYAATFAPALMLMVDRAGSQGVFVRPRPGRLELCGEYVAGDRLRGAVAMFAGSARLCAAAVGGDARAVATLPPALAIRLRPATGRYGHYVGRRSAFGFDLYERGRSASLPTVAGGVVTAQRHLELTWEAARTALGTAAAEADLDPAGRIVGGSRPLGIECDDYEPEPDLPYPPAPPSPFGDLLSERRRRGLAVSARIATWDFTVFAVEGRRRTAYACIPRSQLATFLERLDRGRLDELLRSFADSEPQGLTLAGHDDTAQAGLWDAVGDEVALLHPERGPSGAYTETGAHPRPKGRSGKLLPLVCEARAAPASPDREAVPADTGTMAATKPARPAGRVIVMTALLLAMLAAMAVAAAGMLSGSSPVTTVTTTVVTAEPAQTSTSSLERTLPATSSPGPAGTVSSTTSRPGTLVAGSNQTTIPTPRPPETKVPVTTSRPAPTVGTTPRTVTPPATSLPTTSSPATSSPATSPPRTVVPATTVPNPAA